MATSWFYGHDGNRIGPCSDRQLRDLADAGLVVPSDTIWKEGVPMGVSAGKVKNLFSTTTAATPTAVKGVPPTKVHLPPAAGPETLAPESTVGAAPGEPETEHLPEEAPAQQPPAPDEPVLGAALADAEVSPWESRPAPAPVPDPLACPVSKKRAVAGRGVILVGQDGTSVKLIKKCTVCGYQDCSRSTLPIRSGMNKLAFFCPKCRKRRDVEYQGFAS